MHNINYWNGVQEVGNRQLESITYVSFSLFDYLFDFYDRNAITEGRGHETGKLHTPHCILTSAIISHSFTDALPLFSTALVCPPNSHYSICVSSCPETCLGINGPPGCSEKCVEGCECNPGFILSDDKCVPVKDCGCVDPSGSYHPVSLKPGPTRGLLGPWTRLWK